MGTGSSRQDQPKRAEILASLRQEIQQFEGFSLDRSRRVRLGLPDIDSKFSETGFQTATLHEILSGNEAERAAGYGFTSILAGLIAGQQAGIVWVASRHCIFAHGLVQFGIDPAQILFVEAKNDQQALFAMEEALQCEGLAVVIGEIPDADHTATRRLQLASKSTGATGLLLRHQSRYSGNSSFHTRWSVKPIPSHLPDQMPGVGFPRWDISLLKARGSSPGNWQVEWRSRQFHLIQSKNIAQNYPARLVAVQ